MTKSHKLLKTISEDSIPWSSFKSKYPNLAILAKEFLKNYLREVSHQNINDTEADKRLDAGTYIPSGTGYGSKGYPKMDSSLDGLTQKDIRKLIVEPLTAIQIKRIVKDKEISDNIMDFLSNFEFTVGDDNE